MGETSQTADHVEGGIPRGALLLGMGAAFVIVMSGIRSFGGSIGPVFLALVIVIMAQPAQNALLARGAPRWVGLIVSLILSFVIIIGIAVTLVWAAGEFAVHLTGADYGDDWANLIDGVRDQLSRLGVDQSDIDSAIAELDISAIGGRALSAVSGLLGFVSTTSVAILAIVFFVIDSMDFKDVLNGPLSRSRPAIAAALSDFAVVTRRYFVVTALFGVLVATIDVVFLLIVGIPLAIVWGVLAVITSFIPNVGFVIGALPPVFLALLRSGLTTAIVVFAGYFVINFIIDSVVKPKIVGDEVGLAASLTFASLVFWSWMLGPLGALLAVPLTLFVKAMLVDSDPDSRWLSSLMSLSDDDVPTAASP